MRVGMPTRIGVGVANPGIGACLQRARPAPDTEAGRLLAGQNTKLLDKVLQAKRDGECNRQIPLDHLSQRASTPLMHFGRSVAPSVISDWGLGRARRESSKRGRRNPG